MINHSVYIPSVDAKDLYVFNHLNTSSKSEYTLLRPDGTVNLHKFSNAFDYSLDLVKLREVYQKVYRNSRFSFRNGEKEYSTRVINVTFKYSTKRFNQYGPSLYVRFGYSPRDMVLENSVCLIDGELAAIQTDTPVSKDQALSADLLGKYFVYQDGQYQLNRNETLHTVARLREELYENGFWCDGVHYVRFKRSSGSSRVGKCLFIDERLYPAMHKYELLGLKLMPGQPVDLAALEAYISLTMSSIMDTIEIPPESILVVDDFESVFKDRAAVTRVQDNRLYTQAAEVSISNSIWDGQSLIDTSLLGPYAAYGMVLLRKNFFKSCCFNTNIQLFFQENNITSTEQLNGFTLAKDISQVKMITTPSSIKFLKFGSLKQWLGRIDSTFGLVKHEKKPPFFEGSLVQTHYQLLNTLQLSRSQMQAFLSQSFDYLDQLKKDPSVLRYHIHYPEASHLAPGACRSKNDIVFQLLGLNEAFTRTRWYSDFRQKNIDAFKKNLRYGHVLINGNYSVLFGNPLEMLMQSIGQFSGEGLMEKGSIHSRRFPYDRVILGSRSPHVCAGNILLANNRADKRLDHYFNLTDEIVCINSIGENILQRLSGAD